MQMAAKGGMGGGEPQYDQFGQICEQPTSHSVISPCAILHNLCPIFTNIQSLLEATQYLEQSGLSIFTELNTNLNGTVYSSIYYSHILKYDIFNIKKIQQ